MPRIYFQCIAESCGRSLESKQDSFQCPHCGDLLEVRYKFENIDPEKVRIEWSQRRLSNKSINRSGVWRFRELIPFLEDDARITSLAEGNTPLVRASHSGSWAGSVNLSVKHQGSNPTGSFKDLGMTTCITRADTQSIRMVACASTGNTSSSMAAYASRAGMKALLFIPKEKISQAKLAQALDFGAIVMEIGNNFDQAFSLLRELAIEMGIYLVNSINPFRIEGQKTIVAEMLEQRGWQSPDYIVVPGGNLGNVSAIGKGLRELNELGFIEKIPRLVVVQAEKASPFVQTLRTKSAKLLAVDHPDTEATAIRIGHPANWQKAMGALKWSKGLAESVTDREILEAKNSLAKDGIGCEPASATTVAGIRKLTQAGVIDHEADIVAVLTGNQLKDTEYIYRHRATSEPQENRPQVESNLDALRKTLTEKLSSVLA